MSEVANLDTSALVLSGLRPKYGANSGGVDFLARILP